MKSVLITGASGYIATRLAEYLRGLGYVTRSINLRGNWAEEDFHGFDTVIHTAGLAHMRQNELDESVYKTVNCDLALSAAAAAKEQNVRQFIFMSSMSVYGLFEGRITAQTPTRPNTPYGRSKLLAEEGLAAMQDESFRVAILRPPMIYGKGCKGNYPRLSRLILKLPAFPRVSSERSMLYIGCFCGFIRRLIESGEGGLYFPQNKAYVSIDVLAREIMLCHGRRPRLPAGFGWLLKPLSKIVPTIGKVFGSLTYDMSMSAAFSDEPQPDFAETIRLTEEES